MYCKLQFYLYFFSRVLGDMCFLKFIYYIIYYYYEIYCFMSFDSCVYSLSSVRLCLQYSFEFRNFTLIYLI